MSTHDKIVAALSAHFDRVQSLPRYENHRVATIMAYHMALKAESADSLEGRAAQALACARAEVDKAMADVESALAPDAPGTPLSVTALADEIEAIVESHLRGVGDAARRARAGREARREMHLRIIAKVML